MAEGGEAAEEARAAGGRSANGRLDPGDARYGEFRVWMDRDGDGVGDPGEVLTLAEAGIDGIGLVAPRDEQVLEGAIQFRTTEVARSTGPATTAFDVALMTTGIGSEARLHCLVVDSLLRSPDP